MNIDHMVAQAEALLGSLRQMQSIFRQNCPAPSAQRLTPSKSLRNGCRRWTKADIEQLWKMVDAGVPLVVIAEKLGRTPKAVSMRRAKMPNFD